MKYSQEIALKVLNYIIFYVVWYLSLYAGKTGKNSILFFATIIMLLFHNIFKVYTNEYIFIFLTFFMGIFLEVFFINSGYYTYSHNFVCSSLMFPPVWIICMWLTISLQWCKTMGVFICTFYRRMLLSIVIVGYYWFCQSIQIITWSFSVIEKYPMLINMILLWIVMLEVIIRLRRRLVF